VYELSSQIFGSKQYYTKLTMVFLLKNGNNEMQINNSFRIENFQRSQWRDLWDAWEILFMALCQWISMAVNQNCATMFSENMTY
jgi:hypothetical protein